MELCLNTRTFAGRPLEEALQSARGLGLSCVELGATLDCPHVRLQEGVEGIRPLLDGLRVVALTADHPDLARARGEGREEAVAHTRAALECAARLGAGVVTTSLGSTEIDAWESAWERAVSALAQALRETARLPVRLAVEIHADDVLDSLKKARRLLMEIEDHRLGLTFDTGLLYYRRIDLKEALEVAGDRLYHVHVRDATRQDHERSIGRGEIRFAHVFRQLREHGYDGSLSIELLRTQERHGLSAGEALAESVPLLREALEGGVRR